MFEVDYQVESGLEKLFQRLKKGQRLKGCIIDTIEPDGYLLRIHGYNILTQSKEPFNKFDEIELVVQEIDPHLTLNLVQEPLQARRKVTGMDILI